ncbi:MAG: hypothetical protein PWP23_3357 [Candidatus Sumerlaeota bacterium]|nr:hypothetical protein [Candidatus Sumerlaeota bacterium]
MRILHTMASHRWTGAAEPAARVAAGQIAEGHEVLFALTAGASFDEKAQALGVKTSAHVPFERSYLPHKKLRDLRLLKELIAGFRPDIVHAHLTHDHVLCAAALGKSSAPLLVRTFHREETVRRGAFARWLMARTHGAISISESMTDQLKRAYSLDERHAACIGGGIDTTRFAPSERGALRRETWGIAPDAPVLGTVSRIRVARGFAWLLDAAALALPPRPEARLVICGRGNWKDEMLQRLETHPARAQIVYAGYVRGSDLEDSYNAFDAALLLKPGNDGACRSALEAMACARPVIGGDVGAIHDLLNDGEAGWLVPLDDVEQLARAMGQALDNRAACHAMGAAARRKIEHAHGEDAMTRRTLEFYEGLRK